MLTDKFAWLIQHREYKPYFYVLVSEKRMWHAYEPSEMYDVDDWEVEYTGGVFCEACGRMKTDMGYIPLYLCFQKEDMAKKKANEMNEEAKARRGRSPKNWKEAK